MDEVVRYVVYPCLGIARVGNSPDEYFIGPEAPGEVPRPEGGYKDDAGRIKRQAARFRVYGLNEAGEAVREITAGEAEITWRVHLANRKAGWYQFQNAMDLGPKYAKTAAPRNRTITGDDRKKLIIDPGQRTITGRDTKGDAYHFDSGEFMGKKVPLGELRTDSQGRLLVLGGYGDSASYTGKPANTFANNEGWHDDTSDGPVRATVKIGGQEFEAEPAAVAVTPPNYGQGLYGPVTMYDVVYDLFCRDPKFEKQAPRKPYRPSFWRHIFPIFERLVGNQWVNGGVNFLFGAGSPSDLTAPALLDQLSNPARRRRVERPRHTDVLDGRAVADRRGQLPLRLRGRHVSLAAFLLGGARAQPGLERTLLPARARREPARLSTDEAPLLPPRLAALLRPRLQDAHQR